MTIREHCVGRRTVDLVLALAAVLIAVMFVLLPGRIAAADDMGGGTGGGNTNSTSGGYTNNGGNTNSCSCVNGHCTGNACPVTPAPKSTPATGSYVPPSAKKATPKVTPQNPTGSFVDPQAATATPAITPTAQLSADPPVPTGAMKPSVDPKLISTTAGNTSEPNNGMRALGVALGLSGIGLGIAATRVAARQAVADQGWRLPTNPNLPPPSPPPPSSPSPVYPTGGDMGGSPD